MDTGSSLRSRQFWTKPDAGFQKDVFLEYIESTRTLTQLVHNFDNSLLHHLNQPLHEFDPCVVTIIFQNFTRNIHAKTDPHIWRWICGKLIVVFHYEDTNPLSFAFSDYENSNSRTNSPKEGGTDVNFLRNSHYSKKHAHSRNSTWRLKSLVAEFWSLKEHEGQSSTFKGINVKEALSWIFGGLLEEQGIRNSSSYLFHEL